MWKIKQQNVLSKDLDDMWMILYWAQQIHKGDLLVMVLCSHLQLPHLLVLEDRLQKVLELLKIAWATHCAKCCKLFLT